MDILVLPVAAITEICSTVGDKGLMYAVAGKHLFFMIHGDLT